MSADAQPVVDIDQLKRMTFEDTALAIEVLGIFREQADLWGRLLDPAIEQEKWADACHSIKGAARSVGAMALGEACATGEELGRTAGVTKIQASVAVNAVRDRLGEAIEALAEVEHRLLVSGKF